MWHKKNKRKMTVKVFMDLDPEEVVEFSVKLKDGTEVSIPDPPSKKSILNCLKTDLYLFLTGGR